MQVVEYVMPLIKDFRHEIPCQVMGTKYVEVPLRYVGVDKIILRGDSTLRLPTGLFLQQKIHGTQLELKTESPAWKEGIHFSLCPYTKGKPLNIEVVNKGREPVVIFPTIILTSLLVRVP